MLTRTRTWTILPLALCAAVCFTLPAAAKPVAKAPPARGEIQAIYNKINAAAMQKNVDGVYDFDSDDYTVIDQKGRVHEASEGRQDLEQALEVADSVKATTVIQSFTGTDTEATVTIKDHVALSVANAATRRAVKITVDDTAREHWVKTEDGWRRNRTRILSGKNALHKNF